MAVVTGGSTVPQWRYFLAPSADRQIADWLGLLGLSQERGDRDQEQTVIRLRRTWMEDNQRTKNTYKVGC